MTATGSLARLRGISAPLWVAVVAAYVIFTPVSNNVVLYPLLLSVVLLAGLEFWRSDRVVDKNFLVIAGLWVVFVVIGVAVALLRGAESWMRVLVFMAFWPTLFAVLVLGFQRWAIRLVFWAGAIVTILIGVMFAVGALAAGSRVPEVVVPSVLASQQTLRYVVDAEGVIALSAHSLPSLLWWAPMWIASLFCGRRNRYLPPLWLRTAAASMAFAGAMIAWRRGIVVAVVLTPVVILVAWMLLSAKNGTPVLPRRERVLSWVAPVGSFLVVGVGVAIMVQTELLTILGRGVHSIAVTAGLRDPEVDPSTIDLPNLAPPVLTSQDDQLADALRLNESDALTSPTGPVGWLFGKGFGASIDRGTVERDMAPWQTELQYHMLFFWSGLVGVVLLCVIAFFAIRVLRKAFQGDPSLRGVLVVSAVGATAALLGNATNPYLQAPGHMWPVFLPFMVAAVMLRKDVEPAEPRAVVRSDVTDV